MIQSTKPIQYLLFTFLLFCLSCQGESKVFIGEWEDSRDTKIRWKISKNGSTFIGERLTGQDTYKYDTEEWAYEIGEGGFPTLKPKKEGGSTLIFQPKQNRILRTPPGRTYVKVVK